METSRRIWYEIEDFSFRIPQQSCKSKCFDPLPPLRPPSAPCLFSAYILTPSSTRTCFLAPPARGLVVRWHPSFWPDFTVMAVEELLVCFRLLQHCPAGPPSRHLAPLEARPTLTSPDVTAPYNTRSASSFASGPNVWCGVVLEHLPKSFRPLVTRQDTVLPGHYSIWPTLRGAFPSSALNSRSIICR